MTPLIMADELVYSEMAKNLADQGEFLLRSTSEYGLRLRIPGSSAQVSISVA